MKMATILSRHRLLLTNVMALALVLCALAFAPAAAFADDIICDEGCVAWDAQNGCTKMMSCCVRSPDDWTCVEWSPAR